MPFQLTDPLPFQEALDSRAVKSVLPTTLRTAVMSSLPADIRERAFWSAGVTSARFLDTADQAIQDYLNGKINLAECRARLNALREELGEVPLRETTGQTKLGLTDIWSEERQNVFLGTNIRMAEGYGQFAQGMDPDVLDEFPAWEFERLESRLHPRNESPDPEKHWDVRWEKACMDSGDLLALKAFNETGRMVALKTSGVWIALSRFGLPYDPVDFNTGMGRVMVDRDEAEKLGLIQPGHVLTPQTRGFNDDFQLTPDVRNENLLNALLESFKGTGIVFKDGVLTAA
jgi:hypothetical protein